MKAVTGAAAVLVLSCAFAVAAAGQDAPPASGAEADAPGATAPVALPHLHDWFLSTGRWADDPQIYVREVGHGPRTIVMVHGGWGGEHSGLVTAVRGLEDGRRFVLYDQRGSLRSPAPDASISFDRHVEDLELLRRELGLERLTLVGHSMGAILASAYATRYPARIERLVLISPAYLKNPIPESEKPLQHQGYLASQAFLGRDAVARELQAYRLERSEPPLSSQEETAKFRIGFAARMLADVSRWRELEGGRTLFKADVGALTSKTYPAGGWDYIAEFAQRTYPVGIIVGDRDFLDMGTPLLSAWARAVPRLELSILPNAGHLPWIDQPEAFRTLLPRHLDRGGLPTPGARQDP
jgi:pimeloyl-ACP methyl ester carboxylesterase